MFGEQIGIKLLELFQSSKDKPLAQSQLQPVLERRLEPCIELWKVLWKWMDHNSKAEQAFNNRLLQANTEIEEMGRSSFYDEIEFEPLSDAVEKFLIDYGAVVSYRCLAAMTILQNTLRMPVETRDEYGLNEKKHKVIAVMNLLVPSTSKDWKGNKETKEPGILLLLRDEIGSNALSAASGINLK